MAFLDTCFLATREPMVRVEQKDMTVPANAADILYTPAISGVAANFLRKNIVAAGLEPHNLSSHGALDMENEAKARRTIWSAAQGVAAIAGAPAAAELCNRLAAEYAAAMSAAAADPLQGRGVSS